MKDLKNYNFLTFINNYNKEYEEDLDQENSLNSEERKQLYFCEILLKDLSLILPEYKYGKTDIPISQIKEENLSTPHICNDGTCSHGICSKIGMIVKCDTGCTYCGA